MAQIFSSIQAAEDRREVARQRLMGLIAAKQAYTREQTRQQEEADYSGNTNLLGKAGSGAISGLMAGGGPWGALAGAGIGLAEGAVESYSAQKRAGKSNNEILWGKKNPGVGDYLAGGASILTGGMSSILGGTEGHGGGLIGDVGSGGISGTMQQAREGKLNPEAFVPGSKYTARAYMLGAMGGGVTGKVTAPKTAGSYGSPWDKTASSPQLPFGMQSEYQLTPPDQSLDPTMPSSYDWMRLKSNFT